MADIMLDIETLGTRPNAVMLTIGAVKFDPFGDDRESIKDNTILMPTFYRRVDPASFDWDDKEINEDTLRWWASQSDEVKEEAFTEHDRHDIRDVMRDFYKWCGAFDRVWANGPAFDIVILEHINKQISRGNPWQYYQVCDARTIYNLADHERPNPALHHALWDCWSQVVALQSTLRNAGIKEFRKRK